MGDYDSGWIYEGSSEHRMAEGEGALFAAMLRSLLEPATAGARVLDFGCGTGLVAVALQRAGFSVTGLDPRANLLADGLALHPELAPGDLVAGDAAQPALFPPAYFDAIVSRQVLCHLADIETVFATWRTWLRPGGVLLLVDGFWPRSSWKAVDLAAQPFAALSDAGPVRAALAASGFRVIDARAFGELDVLRRASFGASVLRYLVTARRCSETGPRISSG